MRDRLIKLILNTPVLKFPSGSRAQGKTYQTAQNVADHLLTNGVIVPPVSVGQTVYVVSRYYGGLWRIHECRVFELTIYEKHIFMRLVDRDYNFGIEISEIGKTVFLTKEEAETALERSAK